MSALQPSWAAPGPTLYATLMDEALSDSIDLDAITRFVPDACHADFMAACEMMLRRLYVRGVATGYEQAVMRLDATRTEGVA